MNKEASDLRFQGYLRKDGKVGTRNFLAVAIVGNCAASAARMVAQWFTPERLARYPNVDGVIPVIHELGCGMEKSGEPMNLLRRTLGGAIRNPNVAGAVVMALGCDRNNIYAFLEQEHLEVGPALQSVVLQEVGGTARAVERGVAAIEAMLPWANETSRRQVALEHLCVGVLLEREVRGSMSHAAINAAVDLLVAAGGTVVMSQTMDAATELAGRSTETSRQALEQRIHWWKSQLSAAAPEHTATAATPAPGIPAYTGRAHVEDVVAYAHAVSGSGLILMDSPSNLAVCATGQIAAGATLLCASARGADVFNAAGAPAMCMSAADRSTPGLSADLDLYFDADALAVQSPEQLGSILLNQWIAHAGGEPTRGEEFGMAETGFAPWPIGVFA
ncbi:UxaA family hydrolase [Candidimonas nitroreducens]|uniref:Galactonate dehydratase n=1 Tax=Candidimonas nitroreducens TaxID=683354 RepID=A0A225MY78_9BURK|nr:UxaA family hydrolase [Candidimonas nitroreducens]OWT66175.1 galactonate dehydratase [Candidimonas nitroreducens]